MYVHVSFTVCDRHFLSKLRGPAQNLGAQDYRAPVEVHPCHDIPIGPTLDENIEGALCFVETGLMVAELFIFEGED